MILEVSSNLLFFGSMSESQCGKKEMFVDPSYNSNTEALVTFGHSTVLVTCLPANWSC